MSKPPRTKQFTPFSPVFSPKVDAEDETGKVDPDAPIIVPNRRTLRKAKTVTKSQVGMGKVHDALKLGPRPGRPKGKTGKPPWFLQMKAEAAQRKALEMIATDRLEPIVGRVAIDLFLGGYENVWKVSQAESINQLLLVGRHDCPPYGIRHEDLKKLRDYLLQQKVPVKWEA